MQYLLSILDPNTQMIRPLQEELPDAMSRARYPLTLTKSSLLAVGAPTTWPSVLAALHWVVELLALDSQLVLGYLNGEGIMRNNDGNDPSSSGGNGNGNGLNEGNDGKKTWLHGVWKMRFDKLGQT
jgi:hypothetical protein